MERSAVRTDHRSQHVGQRDLHRLYHRDPTTESGTRRRHLRADEPGAYHYDATRLDGGQCGSEAYGIVERPQCEQPVTVPQALRPPQLPRGRSPREHARVPRQDRAVVDLDLTCLDIEAYRSMTEDFVHLQLAAAFPVSQDGLFGWPGPRENLLGQWRSVVGQMQLLTHQRDRDR